MIQIPFADVMTGLQTGLISGGETGTMIYAVASLDDEAPHLTLTRHAYSAGVTVAHKSWFDDLSPMVQKAITDSMPPVTFIRTILWEWIVNDLQRLRMRGATVHDLSPNQRAVWQTATERHINDLINQIGGEAQTFHDTVVIGDL